MSREKLLKSIDRALYYNEEPLAIDQECVVDSLDIVEVAMQIEKDFDVVAIDEDSINPIDVRTVKDIVEWAEKELEKPRNAKT